MAGLVPAIYVFPVVTKIVDARDESGHDEALNQSARRKRCSDADDKG